MEGTAKEAFEAIIADVVFAEYEFAVIQDDSGRCYLQGRYLEPDIVSGTVEVQKTRKWLLSTHMTKSEVVQTAF